MHSIKKERCQNKKTFVTGIAPLSKFRAGVLHKNSPSGRLSARLDHKEPKGTDRGWQKLPAMPVVKNKDADGHDAYLQTHWFNSNECRSPEGLRNKVDPKASIVVC